MPENQRNRGSAAVDGATAQAIGKQAQTQVEYGLQLYKHVVKNLEGFDKNALLSPASIATALALTAAGAQGATLDQFVAHLKHKDAQDMHKFNLYVHNVILSNNSSAGGPALGAANGLWIDERTPFNEQFARNVKAAYGAEAQEADFRLKAGELCKDINDWVRMKTGGKATNILSTEVLYSYTRLMVVNALSFKGIWKEKFDSELTAPKTFHLLDGGTVAVPMMSSTRKHFIKSYSNWGAQSNYSSFSSNLKVDPWSFDQPESNSSSSATSTGEATSNTESPVSSAGPPFEFKVLKLPYKTAKGKDARAFSMYVFLPEKRDGLPELERDLDAAWLMRELPQLTRAEPVGEFYLPKFKASFSFQVNSALQSLGLTLPFSERKADFSTMLVDDEDSKDPKRIPTGCFCYGLGKKSRPLALSSMVHESVVEVSEEGGAVSGVISSKVVGLTRYNSIDPLYKYNFVADHPFLYLIREDTTGLIVFVGRVTNPKQDDVPLLDL